jgi:DNA-binding FadR family transcriptional regulator
MATPSAPTTPTTPALVDALTDRPDTTTAELAAAAGIGRSTASELLADLATQGRVLRRPGGYQGGRRTPDRWTLITTTDTTKNPADASTALPATTPTTQAAHPERSRPAAGRLGAGQLRELVEACLAQRPGQALSATAIATALLRLVSPAAC